MAGANPHVSKLLKSYYLHYHHGKEGGGRTGILSIKCDSHRGNGAMASKPTEFEGRRPEKNNTGRATVYPQVRRDVLLEKELDRKSVE